MKKNRPTKKPPSTEASQAQTFQAFSTSRSLERDTDNFSIDAVLSRNDEVTPYVRLLVQIIRRAVVDYVIYRDSTNKKQLKISTDAGDWIFGQANEESFASICDSVGIDHLVVRRYTADMTEEQARNLRKLEFAEDGPV